LANEQSFAEYRKASLLPRDLLHSSLVTTMWMSFLRGDYDTAVFQAFKAVEIAVRGTAKLTDQDYGVPLMRKAFQPKTGTLRDATQAPANAKHRPISSPVRLVPAKLSQPP